MAKTRSKVNAALREEKKRALKKIMEDQLTKSKAAYAAGKFDDGRKFEDAARDAEKQLRSFTRRRKKAADADPVSAAARALGL